MAAQSQCQINISALEENLEMLFRNTPGRIFRKQGKSTGSNTTIDFSTKRGKIIKDGIYFITVTPNRIAASHAIILLVSENGTNFSVFDPNGKETVNDPDWYNLKVFVNNELQDINTDLSPNKSINNVEGGVCGIWSIVISILLNKVAIGELTEQDKMIFLNFLNKTNNGEQFIQNINNSFFKGNKHYDGMANVRNLVNNITEIIKEQIESEKLINKGGKKKTIRKYLRNTNKRTSKKNTNKKKRNKSRNKKRSKTNKKRN